MSKKIVSKNVGVFIDAETGDFLIQKSDLVSFQEKYEIKYKKIKESDLLLILEMKDKCSS